jgi:hypothetical protein
MANRLLHDALVHEPYGSGSSRGGPIDITDPRPRVSLLKSFVRDFLLVWKALWNDARSTSHVIRNIRAMRNLGQQGSCLPSCSRTCACCSHYVIRKSQVLWAKPMTARQIAGARRRDSNDLEQLVARENRQRKSPL